MASNVLLPMSPAKKTLVQASQPLSTSQSLAMVEIFVNAALACICYTRELIPYHSTCFQSRFMNDLAAWKLTGKAYGAFAVLDGPLQPATSQEFKFLVESENQAGNQILDLLESGLFDSLQKGYLEAAQFFVTPDVKDPTAICESYIFSFTYGNRNGYVTGVELSSSGGSVAVDALKNFKRAIKSLLHGLRDLPRLPRKKSLGMSLTYNSTCPVDYQPEGFHDITPSSQENATGWSSLWDRPNGTFEEFDTGTHCVTVGASNLQPFISGNIIAHSQGDVNFGNQLEKMQKTSSLPSNLVSTLSQPNRSTARDIKRKPVRRFALTSSRRTPLSDLDKVPNSQELNIDKPSTSGKGQTQSIRTDDANIHSSSQYGIQSSGTAAGRSKKSVPKSSAPYMNRRQRNVTPQKLAELIVQACAMENCNQGDYIFNPTELKKNKIVRINPGVEVRCECQGLHQTEDMLICCLCGEMQHMKCYGFGAIDQKRMPDQHFCYACLLLPKEESLNNEMPARVRIRLALIYMYDQEDLPIQIDAHFANALQLDINRAADLAQVRLTVSKLVEEGFVTQLGEEVVEVVKTRKHEAHRKYIDHLAGLWAHYEAAKDGVNAALRLQALDAAVEKYINGRSYVVDEIDPDYDEIMVKDAFGHSVRRWGYYPGREIVAQPPAEETLKRKASSEFLPTSPRARGRKLSIGQFVNADRFTPSTEASSASFTEEEDSELRPSVEN